MKIDFQRMGTVDVLAPNGALADVDVESFVAALRERLQAPCPRFVLDLHLVPYFDSRGIESVVDAARDLQQRGGRLRLAAVTPTCREVLELTGQAACVEFFDQVADAVRSFL